MWCCRKSEISWTDRVRSEEVSQRVKEERSIIHTIKERKTNWIGHILRSNCLLKHVIEVQTDMTGRRGRRRKQLLDDFKGGKRIQETERGSSRYHTVENSLWKRLWTCRKTDCRMSVYIYVCINTCTYINFLLLCASRYKRFWAVTSTSLFST